MSEISHLINSGRKLADIVSRVLVICTPNPKWDEKQAGFRHPNEYSQVSIFLLLKIAGSVSTTNAMLELSEKGFWFQAAILARSVHESNLSIAYMLPKPADQVGSWPSEKQKKALTEFFKETWSDPERPFEDKSQRAQILLKELSAALGHFQPKDADISVYDAGQAAVQTLRFLSDYTHMAYPRLMELFAPNRGYVLSGQQRVTNGFDIRQAAGVLFESCTYSDSVCILMSKLNKGVYELSSSKNNLTLAQSFQAKQVEIDNAQKQIETLCLEIEKAFPVTTADPKKILTKFKKK
jgi:hypothetical protein